MSCRHCVHCQSKSLTASCYTCRRELNDKPAVMELGEKSHRAYCADCDKSGLAALADRCQNLTVPVAGALLSGSGNYGFQRGRNVGLERGEVYLVLPFEGETYEDTLTEVKRESSHARSTITQLVFESGRVQAAHEIADMHPIHKLGSYGYGGGSRDLSRLCANQDVERVIRMNGGHNVARNLATGERVCDTQIPRSLPDTSGDCEACGLYDAAHILVRGVKVQRLCGSCKSAWFSGAYTAGGLIIGDNLTTKIVNEPTLKVGYSWTVPAVVGGWYVWHTDLAFDGSRIDQVIETGPGGVIMAGDEARERAMLERIYPGREKEIKLRPTKGFAEIHGPFDTQAAAEDALQTLMAWSNPDHSSRWFSSAERERFRWWWAASRGREIILDENGERIDSGRDQMIYGDAKWTEPLATA